MRKKPVPLSFTPNRSRNSRRISEINSYLEKPLIGIIETPSLKSAEKPPRTQKILRLPQQVHGSHVSSPQPLTAKDCCSLSGFIGVIWFVHWGIIDCIGHRPLLCLAVKL